MNMEQYRFDDDEEFNGSDVDPSADKEGDSPPDPNLVLGGEDDDEELTGDQIHTIAFGGGTLSFDINTGTEPTEGEVPTASAGSWEGGLVDKGEGAHEIGFWELDPESQMMRWSKGMFTLAGRDEEPGPVPFLTFLQSAHPTDQSKLEKALLAAIENREPMELLHRLILSDLSTRTVSTRARVVETDGIVSLVGVTLASSEDATNRAKIDLASTIFDHTTEALMVTDTKGVIQYVNPAFTQMTGFLPEDAIGQKTSMLKSDHHETSFYKELWKSLVLTGKWRGEIWNRSKTGDVYLAWLSITAVKNAHNTTVNYIGVLSDRSSAGEEVTTAVHQPYRDVLTGLPNRNLFADRLSHAVNHGKRHKYRVAVVTVVVENLPAVREQYGLMAGDMAVQTTGERLQVCLRDEDTVARIGGELFGVIIERWEEGWGYDVVLPRMANSLSSPLDVGGEETTLDIVLELAVYPDDADSVEELIKKTIR
jgi:diguanylate cyclase (GGDEF)-like protein/PAS domain S-box-containing protein